jgi:DNA polymerase zeta
MEKTLRLLFETQNLSEIKSYLQRQWTKILSERISLRDFIFAKEVRLGSYSDRVPPPPAALVSLKLMAADPRAEPQYGERVPYVVVAGGPNARLMDLVVPPQQLLSK